jgi:hypothetical protein
LTWRPASSGSMSRFRAVWAAHAAVGWAVAPRIRTPGGVFDEQSHAEVNSYARVS